LDKCESSLQRHDAIASASQAVGSVLVQPGGQPIIQSTKFGFSRRREVGAFGNDVGPSFIVWSWGEK
jgi:hypothetical protein